MPHTGRMRKVAIALLVVLVLVAAGEFVADGVAERLISDKVEDKSGARTAETSIDSFPLVVRLLATQRVERLTVKLDRVEAGALDIATLEVDLHDVQVSLSDLTNGLRAVDDIGRGVLTATITKTAIGAAAGVPLPEGGPAPTARLAGGTLSLSATGLPEVTIPLGTEVLPCSAAGRLTSGTLRLRCTIREIPARFLQR